MNFYWKKVKKGYEYKVTEAFGVLEITSPKQLSADKLDDVFMAIWEANKRVNSKLIKGDIADTKITYTFKRKNQWTKVKKSQPKKKLKHSTS